MFFRTQRNPTGMELLLELLEYTPLDATREEPMVVSVVDLLWKGAVGKDDTARV